MGWIQGEVPILMERSTYRCQQPGKTLDSGWTRDRFFREIEYPWSYIRCLLRPWSLEKGQLATRLIFLKLPLQSYFSTHRKAVPDLWLRLCR